MNNHSVQCIKCSFHSVLSGRNWCDAKKKPRRIAASDAERGMHHVHISRKGAQLSRVDDVIADQAYILDCLMALRNIYETGSCNECGHLDCGYVPDPGQQVRFNCPFFKRKEK